MSQRAEPIRTRQRYIIRGIASVPAADEIPVLLPASGRIVADASLCSGCRVCEMACSLAHEGVSAPSLARLVVIHDVFRDDHPSVQVCPQCAGPECLIACPTGAITTDDRTGARVVADELCNGCGACVKACHLGMVRMDSSRGLALKCDLCGGEPACEKYCPQNVIRLRRTR